jgi:hypothetical protein
MRRTFINETPQKVWKVGHEIGLPTPVSCIIEVVANKAGGKTVGRTRRAARQDAKVGANLPEFSVSELSAAIRRTLEGAYGYVRLRGEISAFAAPTPRATATSRSRTTRPRSRR